MGEDYLSSDIFDTFRFSGVSLNSDLSMLPPSLRGYAPEVTGISRSGGKVTISQQGRVIHETQVAAGGIVVLLGCAHPGMRNMLDGVKNRLGRPILAVLGGTHLVESKGVSLERSLRYFEEESVRIIGVSHCTGSEAVSRLRASSGNFFHNVTGSSLFLE